MKARGLAGETHAAEQLIAVAAAFYLHGQNQAQIAADLGLSPSTVSRYLKRARDEGIVHVEIRPPRRHHVDLGRELAGRFGLDRAVVLALEGEGPDALFALAAEHIGSLLHTGMRVGISWGQTLAGVVRFLATAGRVGPQHQPAHGRAGRRGTGQSGPRAGPPSGPALSQQPREVPARAGHRRQRAHPRSADVGQRHPDGARGSRPLRACHRRYRLDGPRRHAHPGRRALGNGARATAPRWGGRGP